MERKRNLKDRDNKKKKSDSIIHRKTGHRKPYNQSSDLFGLFLSSLGNQASVQLFGGGVVQTKLNVSRTGDFFEKQADSFAEKVVQTGDNNMVQNISGISKVNSSTNKTLFGKTESKIKNLKGKGNNLSKPLRDFFEPRFGVDLGTVHIHTDTNAGKLADSLSARAFTYGTDIVFSKGEYRPETTEGRKLIAHELTHVIQQGGTDINCKEDSVVQRLSRIPTYAQCQIHTPCYIYETPNLDNKLTQHGNTFELNEGYWVSIMGYQGDWLNIETELIYGNGWVLFHGWIRREWTSVKQDSDPANEKNWVLHDIDNFFKKVLITFDAWYNAIIDQADAYYNAYDAYFETLKRATEQAELRAEIIGLILTTALVGGLGWIGEAVKGSKNLIKLLQSETVRGTIEDVLQCAIGETIDINQTRMHETYICEEVHPFQYKNSLERTMGDLKVDLKSHLESLEYIILHSPVVPHRIEVLTELYKWWNSAPISQVPNIAYMENGDQKREKLAEYEREVERGFWKHYLLEKNVKEGFFYDHYHYPDGIYLHNLEGAVKDRLEVLGIKDLAGITEWTGLFAPIWGRCPDIFTDPFTGKDCCCDGRMDIYKLRFWANDYQIQGINL